MEAKAQYVPSHESSKGQLGTSKPWMGSIPNPESVYAQLDREIKAVIGSASYSGTRAELDKSNTLLFWDFMGGGIGDAVMGLRYVKLAAEHVPDKKCIAVIHPAMMNLRHVNLPINCSLISNVSGEFHHIDYKDAVDIPLSAYGSYDKAKKPGDNTCDIACLRSLHRYGIDVTKKDLERSIISFPESLNTIPVEYTYLFAPDAKERQAQFEDRSMKSLSLGQWRTIFEAVPSGETIGIVMGTVHREYCEAVLKEAERIASERGFTAKRVETPTLDDLADEIVKSQTYVGMDSGTTHWAYEVAVAAKESGRTIHIKEIFNSACFQPEVYALRGAHDIVDVLQGPFFRFGASDNTKNDLRYIPQKDIVEFIFGKSHRTGFLHLGRR